MKAETVKLLDALLNKAVLAGWIPLEQAQAALADMGGRPVRRKKKVKSPELGT